MDEVEQDTRGFVQVYGVAQAAGFVAVVLTGVWMGHFRGGFAWASNPAVQFNWHPLLMVLSMVYLYGNGVLLYRIFRNERKKKLKLAHAIVMGSAFLLAVIGLRAVFDSHNLASPPVPNMYSLHSWLGIATVIMFIMQWVCGLVTFLFPGLASHLRTSYMPAHVFFGILIFVFACATALLGITEKAIFSIKEPKYAEKPPEGILVNWIGLLISIFGVLVVFLATTPRFKRLTRPEDEMLLQETNVNE